MFAADWVPGGFGLDKQFNPARYRGSSIDTTSHVIRTDGQIGDDAGGEYPGSLAELERGVKKLEHEMHPPILPRGLADLEFGDERHYVQKIADLAQKNGAKVAFLFFPITLGRTGCRTSRS